MDEKDNITGEAGKYLLSASAFSLDELAGMTHDAGGLFIPSHIDRPVFSIPSQLGFIPDLNYSALETTVLPCPVYSGEKPLIFSSDAHYPGDIGKRITEFSTAERSFNGIASALKNGDFKCRDYWKF